MVFYRWNCLFLFLLALMIAPVPSGGAEKTDWQVTWKNTVRAAKEEGEVKIYAGVGSALPLQAGVFEKRFPEIKLVIVSGFQEQTAQILAERRAGKHLADVTFGGSSTHFDLYRAKALDPIKDALILPEVVDESKWWGGKHRYIESERKYGFTFIGYTQAGGIYYNTRLVKPDEFQSFWDFLDPKWKGKMAARDLRGGSGTGAINMRIFYYMSGVGSEYIRRLFSEMEITIFRDMRQAVNWLITGKYPICFFCSRSEIGVAQKQGFPVAPFGMMKEGAGFSSGGGNVGLVNRAPHPNAAKVLINWFLSREGQLTMQAEYAKAMHAGSNSLRIDIPKDMIPPDARLIEGINYVEAEVPERMSMEPVLKIYNEALAEAERRVKGAR